MTPGIVPLGMYLKKTKTLIQRNICRTSLVVQWLRLYAPNAEGMGPIPGQGSKIPHAIWHGQKKSPQKTKKYMHSYVHCSVIHNRQGMEATSVHQ